MSANTLPLQVAGRHSALKAARSPWSGLYRVGAISALALVACTFFQAAVFVLWSPPSFLPATSAVADWFALLQKNWLAGLLNLDLVMLFDYVASLLLFLALCVALREANRSLVVVAGALTATGVISYFAANPAFAMLSLAGQHAVATGEAERMATVAAGQAVMANFAGSAFNTSYVLIAIAGLVLTVAMLQSDAFGRRIAYVGMAFYAMNLVPASAGTLGFVLSMASLVPMIAWLVLVARRLLWLARQEGR